MLCLFFIAVTQPDSHVILTPKQQSTLVVSQPQLDVHTLSKLPYSKASNLSPSSLFPLLKFNAVLQGITLLLLNIFMKGQQICDAPAGKVQLCLKLIVTCTLPWCITSLLSHPVCRHERKLLGMRLIDYGLCGCGEISKTSWICILPCGPHNTVVLLVQMCAQKINK